MLFYVKRSYTYSLDYIQEGCLDKLDAKVWEKGFQHYLKDDMSSSGLRYNEMMGVYKKNPKPDLIHHISLELNISLEQKILPRINSLPKPML